MAILVQHPRLFFLYESGDHRILPPSPTRRSPDREPQSDALPLSYSHHERPPVYQILALSSRFPVQRFPLSMYHLDRKSTRLNSSHANISYAVFCLKKKTPHPTASDNANCIALLRN